MFQQKKRWSVGGLGVRPAGYLIMANGFLTNLCILLTPLLFSAVSLYLIVFKVAIDYFLLFPVHKRLGIKKNLKYFLSFEVYYIIYVVAIPFILLTSRKVIWKGRKY
jgi:hypothetical protein